MGQKYADAEVSHETDQKQDNTHAENEEKNIEHTENIESIEHVENNESTETSEANAQQSSEDIAHVSKSAYDELQAKAEDYEQRFLRAQADLENFRRRTRLEKAEAAKYGAIHLIEQLLPVLDNFERALALGDTNKDYDAFVKGMEIIYRQIQQALEQEGLTHIEAVGEPFNPEFHQAIMQVESEEHGEGIVVEEVQKGYILKDRVLRATMVKVSK